MEQLNLNYFSYHNMVYDMMKWKKRIYTSDQNYLEEGRRQKKEERRKTPGIIFVNINYILSNKIKIELFE